MDDDGKTPEDEPPEPARDAAQDEGAKLREVSEEELKQILAAHETWLETDGGEGERADLSRTELQGANLIGAKLQGADLYRAKLQGADLRRADLQGADLRRADLQGANLKEAELLTQQQLDKACGDEETKLSEGLTIETCSEDQ